jgi:hypothetical protein
MSLGREARVSHTISTHYKRHTIATSLAHRNERKDCSMHEASRYMQVVRNICRSQIAPLKFPRVSRGCVEDKWPFYGKFLADHPSIRFQCEPSFFLLYIFLNLLLSKKYIGICPHLLQMQLQLNWPNKDNMFQARFVRGQLLCKIKDCFTHKVF